MTWVHRVREIRVTCDHWGVCVFMLVTNFLHQCKEGLCVQVLPDMQLGHIEVEAGKCFFAILHIMQKETSAHNRYIKLTGKL